MASAEPDFVRHTGVLGGPAAVESPSSLMSRGTAIASTPSIADAATNTSSDDELTQNLTSQAFLAENSGSFGSGATGRDGLLVYRVGKGDNLSKIAAQFGVSLDTIIRANPGVKTKALQVGQELTILPVSGIIHLVVEGDTLEALSEKYRITTVQIINANEDKIIGTALPIGESLVMPGATVQGNGYAVNSSLPDLHGYFVPPVTGWNWGELHPVNAVDIANACGVPVYSAAEGLVTRVGSPTAWNAGYGGLVEIEHPNGTKTRYAHLEKILVSVGDYVVQKTEIGKMGNTGNTHGPSGCHTHFEVEGAKNPFAK